MRLVVPGNVAAAFREQERIDINQHSLTLISLTVNPAVVLGHITVDTFKLTTARDRLKLHLTLKSTHLIGSPKY